ncbi:leucine-rich repeat-containing protein 2 isoform X2 [Poeciliopsis prolifica]|uniref:leucine-rich repeat-containing protein 2 isoform X2 n=1 Tax=Poeciliopsis prolifica TaxID=188132 RepID=UPI00241306DC|nr:leucine-rich repeat-containing protein 2 isoform X2 [Poeciliopsis prolifica]
MDPTCCQRNLESLRPDQLVFRPEDIMASLRPGARRSLKNVSHDSANIPTALANSSLVFSQTLRKRVSLPVRRPAAGGSSGCEGSDLPAGRRSLAGEFPHSQGKGTRSVMFEGTVLQDFPGSCSGPPTCRSGTSDGLGSASCPTSWLCSRSSPSSRFPETSSRIYRLRSVSGTGPESDPTSTRLHRPFAPRQRDGGCFRLNSVSVSRLLSPPGKLAALRRLNVSYNRLSRVPPELGDCEKLERLELAGNLSLSELPFELSSLKQLVHLDISENRFASIPVCALRMSRLQLLDLSNNQLSDLPQDMDRLQQLSTLFVHSNRLSYLPVCLTNISSLRMVVASGDALTCVPTSLCNDPTIKFIRLYDNPERKRREVKDGSEKEFMEAYIGTLKDRDSVPFSTTKVSISCLL